nr:hypothetical protein [Mesorhizobium sp.]
MSHNLALVQNHAWSLARTLMVPVNRELGRDHHHPFGVPLHFDSLGFREPNDSG